MRSQLAEEMGLEFPIFAFTHCRDVAAAVSKAGGLGVLGVAGHSTKGLAAELEWIENEIGDKPYGVDLLLPTKFVGSGKAMGSDELDTRIPEGHRRFLDLRSRAEVALPHHLPVLVELHVHRARLAQTEDARVNRPVQQIQGTRMRRGPARACCLH